MKLFGVLLLVPAFAACYKSDAPACERWEVVDEKVNISGALDCIDWSCGGKRTLVLNFCGEDLEDARAGNTITLSQDNCCKMTRTFVRKQ